MTENKDRDRIVLSSTLKMADLVNLNYSLLSVLSRLGMTLGFGETTVEEACRRHDINISSLLLICNIYTYSGYVPTSDLLVSGSPEDIVRYLHQSHVFYIDKELPELEQSLRDLVAPCEEKLKYTIYNFFAGYKKELENHFAYEEAVVFPYVRSFMSEAGEKGYSIEQFEENHSNIDEKLCDLKNIVMKYLPEQCDPVRRNDVLYHICFLEEDLGKHTLIEDNILIPMMSRLEDNEYNK